MSKSTINNQNINKWAVVVPSLIKYLYGTNSTREHYEWRPSHEIDERGQTRWASVERLAQYDIGKKYIEWVNQNIETIVVNFAEWLYNNNYDEQIVGVNFHVGDHNTPDAYTWYQHNSVFIFSTVGNGYEVPANGWIGADVKITCGIDKDRVAKIVKIDLERAKPYTLIIDGVSRKFKRSQLSPASRQRVHDLIESYDPCDDFRTLGTIRNLNTISNIGKYEIPMYSANIDETQMMQCNVWADPFISPQRRGMLCSDNICCKLWTTMHQPILFVSDPCCTWVPKKRSKGMMRSQSNVGTTSTNV